MQHVRLDNHRAAAHELLSQLFPRFATTFGGPSYGSEWGARWRRENRVCSPDKFETYFRLRVAEGDISETELQTILRSAGDPEAFADHLRALADQRARTRSVSRARVFLERFLDYVPDHVPQQDVGPLLEGLYTVGDELVALNDREGLAPFGNRTYIAWVTDRLLRRLPEQSDRLQLMAAVVATTDSLTAIVNCLSYIEDADQERRRSPQDDATLSTEYLDELRSRAVERLHHAGDTGALRQLPQVGIALSAWARWSEDAPVEQYVADWTRTDEGLADFVARVLGYSMSGTLGGGNTEPGIHIQVEWQRYVADVAEVSNRAQRLLEQGREWLTAHHVAALRTFLQDTSAGEAEVQLD